MSGGWTKGTEIAATLVKSWDKILSDAVESRAFFPKPIKLSCPPKAQWVDCWDEMIAWAEDITRGSKKGLCYQVLTKSFSHPSLGRNFLPTHVVFQSPEQACRYIGRWAQYQQFTKTVVSLTDHWPQLTAWAVRYPQKVLRMAGHLSQYCNLLQYFSANQPCGQYLRELSIPQVDTKFIEQNKALIGELLDCILPEERIDQTAQTFEGRYLLQEKSPMVRFRILDDRQRLGGLSDLTVPLEEFQTCDLAQETFFLVENELTFLTFPPIRNACVIFGKGYSVEVLRAVTWLQSRGLYYWGDLDTHGFQILSLARSIFPHITSFLMDEATLLAHRDYWVTEDKPVPQPPTHLTDQEFDTCCHLQSNRWGRQIRLEQERIGADAVRSALGLLGVTQ